MLRIYLEGIVAKKMKKCCKCRKLYRKFVAATVPVFYGIKRERRENRRQFRLFCVGRMPCKKVRAFGTLSHCAFTKNAWEGLKSGVSQKTCHCMTEILQPAENGRSLESIYGMFFHIFNAVPYGFPDIRLL